jgi:hypothetical protein
MPRQIKVKLVTVISVPFVISDIRFRFSARAIEFSFFQSAQPSSGGTPLLLKNNVGLLLGINGHGRKADHSRLSGAKFKTVWDITPLHYMP